MEVTIHKLEEGVFHSQLTCNNGKETIEIDARTSDAIALALRFKCPIYTTPEIIERAGIVLDFEQESDEYSSDEDTSQEVEIDDDISDANLSDLNIFDLNQLLDKAVKQEDYEKASKIRDEINRRKSS